MRFSIRLEFIFPERPESSMTHTSSEGSTVSTDDLGVPPTPPRSPPAGDHMMADHHLNPTPKSSLSQPQRPARSKGLMVDGKSMGQKKKIPSSVSPHTGRPAWNSGLGNSGLAKGREEMKRRSSSDLSGGYAISRSRSTNSEGGFQSLSRNTPARKSLSATRSSKSQDPPNQTGKWTWTGRGNRGRPPVNNDSYRPPAPQRGVRSASASPGPIRRNFGHSAPVTPHTRSPKTSAPNSNLASPTHANFKKIPDIPDMGGEPSVSMLAQLEELVNSYRARVLDHYAEEGKAPPPTLANDFSCSWARDTQSLTNSPKKTLRANQLEPPPVKITPRKDGLGSRIPAPTFYSSRNTPS